MPKEGSHHIFLEEIEPTDAQIRTLYELLKARRYGISHSALPSFVEHENFVKKHPYRAWYLIRLGNYTIGSVYLQKDNSIGVNFIDVAKHKKEIIEALKLILSTHEPLSPIKSVRSRYFTVNLHCENRLMSDIIRQIGGELAQHTYIIN